MPSQSIIRKKLTGKEISEEYVNDDFVPIPIQFFFWNQTSLFIKKKFGKLTEAHAMNFEKVLVQNILHGLSPGLSDAISSISRWTFIKASFPHILHACAATLAYRKDNLQGFRLDKTETKLLYTLHWLILDAASECMDNANLNKNKKSKSSNRNYSQIVNSYLHSVSTIQLFVYLFIPILSTLKLEDLNNLKLSNGLKIWEPLWAYRQPNIPIFNTPVKQKKQKIQEHGASDSNLSTSNALPIVLIKTSDNHQFTNGKRHSVFESHSNTHLEAVSHKKSISVASSFGDIYMGDDSKPLPGLRTSQELSVSKMDINENDQKPFLKSNGSLSISESHNNICQNASCKQNNLSISTEGTISDVNTIVSFNICETKSHSETENDLLTDSSSDTLIKIQLHPPTDQHSIQSTLKSSPLLKAPIANMSSICNINESGKKSSTPSPSTSFLNYSDLIYSPKTTITDDDLVFHSDKKIQKQATASSSSRLSTEIVRSATFFDVAVMRCLLSSKWHSEGYIWALEYLGHRVSEITDYVLKEQDAFMRFNKSISVPTRLNDLCITIGLGANPADEEDCLAEDFVCDNKSSGLSNEFVEMVNQIYNENDFTNPIFTLGNYYDHEKRKKYQANYHNRIRRIKYIDEDLQPRFKPKPVVQRREISSPNDAHKSQLPKSPLPITPFTFDELQALSLEDEAYRRKLKKEFTARNLAHRNKPNNSGLELPKYLTERLNKVVEKLTNTSNIPVNSDTSPLNAQPLNRLISYSDTHINYQANYKDLEEASGSSGLINLDGSLNLNMVLKGLHSVILKENSLKLCELTLFVLENLMNIDIMPSEEIDKKLEHAKKNLDLSQSSHSFLDDLEIKYNENFYLATDVALRNIKWLGCPNCHPASKTFLNEQLRGKIKLLLGRLHTKNPQRFRAFFVTFIQTNEVSHIIETFHALLAYCHDPYTGFGHYHPYVNLRNINSRNEPRTECKPSFLYSNNQGRSHAQASNLLCELSVNIESVVVDLLLKPLVNRLIDMKDELMNQENLYLFSDVRSLFGYIKENHGGIFRKVVFSNMLEPLIKLKHENQERDSKLRVINEKLTELETIRRILIKQDETATNNKIRVIQLTKANTAVDLDISASVTKLDSNQNSHTSINLPDDSPTGSPNRRDTKNSNNFWPLRLANRRKNNKRQNSTCVSEHAYKYQQHNSQDYLERAKLNGTIDLHSVSSSNFLSVVRDNIGSQSNLILNGVKDTDQVSMRSRRSSSTSLKTLVNIKIKLSSNPKTKKAEPAFDAKYSAILRRQSNVNNHQSPVIPKDLTDLEAVQHAIDLANHTRKRLETNRPLIDTNLVYKGIEYYRFLGECLPPGSIPDVPFMSAVLELRAPLLSKAAFLLETAHFVNRCNHKDWPEWIKMNIGAYLPRTGSSSSPRNAPNPMRRNKIFQLAAANMFTAWAEVLGSKLEKILDEQKQKNVQQSAAENNSCLTAEDYYDESLVNPDGNNCPFALQNIVCILLFEITAFLRETYQYMSKRMSYSESSTMIPTNRSKIDKMNSICSGAVSTNNPNSESINGTGISGEIMSDTDALMHGIREKRMSRIEILNRKSSTDNVSLNPADKQQANESGLTLKRISFKVVNSENLKSESNIGSKNIHSEEQSAVSVRSVSSNSSQKNKQRSTSGLRSFKRASLKIKERLKAVASVPNSGGPINEDFDNNINMNPPSEDNTNYQTPITGHNNFNYINNRNETWVSTSVSHTANPSHLDFCEVDEIDYNRPFPWIGVVVKLMGSLSFECEHSSSSRGGNGSQKAQFNKQESGESMGSAEGFNPGVFTRCDEGCYLSQFKSGHCLIEAVLRMYQTSSNMRVVEDYEKKQSVKDTLKKNSSLKTGYRPASSLSSSGKNKHKKEQSVNQEPADYLKTLLKKVREPSTVSTSASNLRQLSVAQVLADYIIKTDPQAHTSLRHGILKPPQATLHTPTTIAYIYNQVQHLNQIPLLVLCKGVLIMPDELFIDLIRIVWNLLLNSDQDIASSAATLFIISAIKQPQIVEDLLAKHFKSPDINVRYLALLKFESLWKFRFHVWPRLEANANNLLKISPPCIEFVLPSPLIGVPNLTAVDPAWMIKAKTKVTEVTANSEEKRAVVTANKSRKKHHQEVVYKAFQTDVIARKLAREKFLFTNLNYLNHAAYEPQMFQSKDDSDEVVDDPAESTASDLQQSQPVFPSAISTSVVHLIDLLDDTHLTAHHHSISVLASRIIRSCLIEDAALFLRFFFEKITQKNRKNTLIQYLRVLISTYVDLPPQTAHTLFNYLLGVVMYFVRISTEGSQEAVSSILSLIWQIVSHVNGIVFKDLKQILKKEQCEPSLLVTANMPSAKKIIVHGPDLSQIPTQSVINEDTQFLNILQESFEFFGIAESKRDRHFLFDVKTNQIHIPDTYVRNFYFFRRNFSPQLSLVQMDPNTANKLLEKTAFDLKCLEESKVLFFRKLLNSALDQVNHSSAAFLHDELTKLPMFPRKPLEADFYLYPKLPDRELITTDMLHKYSWCQLVWSLFASMDSKTASTWDLTSFLHVINGSLILHPDDFNMIRTCLAIYVNAARHFRHVFATNGFLIFLPTLVKVYSNTQANPQLKHAIEFACIQFYSIHKIPFILQFFGSVAHCLDTNTALDTLSVDTTKIHASCFLDILLALETNKPQDTLKISELTQPSQEIANLTDLFLNSRSNSTTDVKNQIHDTESINAKQQIDASLINTISSTTPGNISNLITTNNLLLTSAGALDLNQINTLTNARYNSITNGLLPIKDDHPTIYTTFETHIETRQSLPAILQQPVDHLPTIDPTNDRFSIIDAVNVCVSVVAYATHAQRANQMLIVLNAILPRYLNYIKSETDACQVYQTTKKQMSRPISNSNQEVSIKARAELVCIQRAACALKTLVNSSDLLTRVYTGPKTGEQQQQHKESLKEAKGVGVSVVQPDDDSIRFSDEIGRPSIALSGYSKNASRIDEKQMRAEFRSPRDLLLNIVSEFVHFASARIKDLYKFVNDPALKVNELLDTKTHFKLVEVANALLKMWDDASALGGKGLQNYFVKLMPIVNWSEDDMKPALSNLLRRIERLFSKISKRRFNKRYMDWSSISGILTGLHATLDHDENLAKILYFKLLINSAITLVINDPSLVSSNSNPLDHLQGLTNPSVTPNNNTNTNTTSFQNTNTAGNILLSQLTTNRLNNSTSIHNADSNVGFQFPPVLVDALIHLVGKYINCLKDQPNLEYFYCSIIGSNHITSPISMSSGLSYLVNFLMPLLLYSASETKEAPKLNSNDLTFIVTMLLNAVKPPSKLAATLLLQAPKQHHLTAFDAASGNNPANSGPGAMLANQKTAKHMKDTIIQSTFLAFKLITYAFNKQIELTRIALSLRQMFSKPKTIYFWRFVEFTCMNKTPLFLLIKPFVEAFVASQDCETEQEQVARLAILNSLMCTVETNFKSRNAVLEELALELKAIQIEIQEKNSTPSNTRLHSPSFQTITVTKIQDTQRPNNLARRLSGQIITTATNILAKTPLRRRISLSEDISFDKEDSPPILETPLESPNLSEQTRSFRKFLKPPTLETKKRTVSLDLNYTSTRARTKLEKLRFISQRVEEDDDPVFACSSGETKSAFPESNGTKIQVVPNMTSQQTTNQVNGSNSRAFDLRSKKLTKLSEAGKGNNAQSPIPRKKFEKLNSKSGADIIEVYKAKYVNELKNVQTSPKVGISESELIDGHGLISSQNLKIVKETNAKIEEAEKENEVSTCTNDKAVLMPDNIKPIIEMKLSKKKKIVFV